MNRFLRVGTMTLLLLGTFMGRVLGYGDILVVAAFLATMVAAVSLPSDLSRVHISITALVAITWVTFTVLWSINPGTTARRVLAFGLLAISATILGSLSSSEDVRDAIKLACRITVLLSLMTAAVAPGWAIQPPGQNAPGLQGVALQKNQLGFIACIGIGAEGLGPPSRMRKFWFATYIVTILLSKSSTALAVAMLVGALLWIVSSVSSIRDRYLRVAFITVVLGPAVALAALVFIDPNFLTGLLGKDPTLNGRSEIWAVVIDGIKQRPLLGRGWNSVWPTQQGGFFPSDIAFETVRRAGFPVINAHNGYLDIVLGAGIVGLATFVALTISALGRHPLKRENCWRAAVVLAFVVDSLSESNYNLGFVAILFFLAPRHVRENRPAIRSSPDQLIGDDHRRRRVA